MPFYLPAVAPCAPAADQYLECPGGDLFREKPCRCARAAFGGARRRPKSSEVALETSEVAKMEPDGSLLGGPGHPFGRKIAIVAPCENIGIYYVFVTFTRPGPIFFAFQTRLGSRQGPGRSFSLFWASPVRKSDASGGRRGPTGSPNAPKSSSGDLPKSMKNRLCGLKGVPGLCREASGYPPGLSREVPAAGGRCRRQGA